MLRKFVILQGSGWLLGRAGNLVRRWFLHKDERRKGEEEHGLAGDAANCGKTEEVRSH